MTQEQNILYSSIGNYRIIARLAQGGSSTVYIGKHAFLPDRRLVAIKVLHPEHLSSQREREQLLQEARLLEKLKHPFIIPIIDAGVQEQVPYIIMEYLSGGSLQDCLALRGSNPLPLQEVICILVQVGLALHYAHQQNVVHCDLKPANILLNGRGEAVLADFGIATVLAAAQFRYTATVMGTLTYMSPEQFRGVLSREGDQYALACLAYTLFTGRPPFLASSTIALMRAHLYENPLAPTSLNPSLPDHIEHAVLKGMSKYPSDRYPNIAAFLTAIQMPWLHSNMLRLSQSQRDKVFWLHQGNLFYKEREFQGALAAYNMALQLDPRFTVAYINKGAVLFCLRRYAASLAAYNTALHLNPHCAAAYHGRSLVFERLGRSRIAFLEYQKAQRLGYKGLGESFPFSASSS